MKIRPSTRQSIARAAPAAAALLAAALLTTAPAAVASGVRADASAAEERAEYPLAQSGHPDGAGSLAVRGPHCRASIDVSSLQILAGESVTVSGTLECPEGINVGSQTVSLLAHTPKGASGFAELASVTSGPDGSYRFSSPAIDENTILFVRLARGHSARRRIRVAPKISLLAPADGTQLFAASPSSGLPATNTVTFAGAVTPAASDEVAVLQRELPEGSGRWRRIALGAVDESGHYSITHTFKRPGAATVRVLVRSRGERLPTASESLTYAIAARPRPVRAARSRARVRHS